MDFSETPEHRPVVRERSTYLTDSEAATVCTIFADGLQSGMGYAKILEILERQQVERRVVDRLRHSLLDEGDMLGEAFARYGLLDPTARKLLYVAEQQGRLPTTFKSLSRFYNRRHERRVRFLTAMTEPLFLIMVGNIAINLLRSDLENFIMHGVSGAIAQVGPVLIQAGIQSLLFGLLALLVGMAAMHMPVDFALRNAVHRLWLVLPIPIFNTSSRLTSISVFCQYTEQSISSGLTVHRALALAAEASNNPRIDRKIHIAQRAIEDGQTLTAGLKQMGSIPNDVVDYVDIGEETGRLEERFSALAERYEELAKEAFERAISASIFVTRVLIIILVMVFLMLAIVTLARNALSGA